MDTPDTEQSFLVLRDLLRPGRIIYTVQRFRTAKTCNLDLFIIIKNHPTCITQQVRQVLDLPHHTPEDIELGRRFGVPLGISLPREANKSPGADIVFRLSEKIWGDGTWLEQRWL